MGAMLHQVLAARLRTEPVAPLVTCYGREPHERSEFSARSLINWIDKTANLIVDEFDLEAGDQIALPVLAEHPHHWMAWVWALAAWRSGMTVRTDALDGADLVVGGPTVSAGDVPTLACSLHPLGMPLTEVGAGVIDYVAEVRSQPDAWLGMDPDADAELWAGAPWDGATWDELNADVTPDPERALIQPTAPEGAMRALLQALPLGSVVAVPTTWADADVERIAATEKATRR